MTVNDPRKITVDIEANTEGLDDAIQNIDEFAKEVSKMVPNIVVRNNEVVNITIMYGDNNQ